MSRTDSHAPLWVRITRRELGVEPAHDHRDGICDLPPTPSSDWSPRSPGTCYWTFAYTGIRICSCSLCYDSAGRRNDLQRERRNAASRISADLRRWRIGDAAAFDDISTPRRRRDWW
ncbi:hypothetical protein CJ178_05780 [Rhodococcus sp. ACPA4]|nr:hypothetical protein CJ178_05780 [Rhodococcus sp. ACPA4]